VTFHGLVGAVLSVVAICCLAGCATSGPTATSLETPSRRQATIRILALGDSYTIGESVEPAGRWPVQLADRLRQQGLAVADPEIIARTGWTTTELQAGILAADPQGDFDLVTLLIGVNNQYRGYPLQEYRAQFQELLQQSVGFAGGDPRKVVVLSIPDWGVTQFAWGRNTTQIAQEIDTFNAVNRDESLAVGVIYVDITPDSRRVAEESNLTATDGLHPSAQMYALWVDRMLPQVLDTLEAK
jgi:lysophospholipase L1-like esterase